MKFFTAFSFAFCLNILLYAGQHEHAHTVIIKKYDRITDKQAIKNLIEEHWDMLCGGYIHGYKESIADSVLDVINDCCNVLYQDDLIIGFIKYSIKSDNRAHIDELAIHTKFQNQGLGTFLLQHAIDEITALDIEYLTIDTMLYNVPACGLYEHKFEFEPLYLKVYKNRELDEESLPVLSLAKALGVSKWNDEIKKMIIDMDQVAAQVNEYRIIQVY